MDVSNFKARKVCKTAKINLKADIVTVFPLFGAFEERKWAEGWYPQLIYPDREVIEEGTTFKTKGRGHGEEEFIWRVSKYDPDQYLIQYLVTTPNRYWTITVQCHPVTENQTEAVITYAYFGLNALGNQINDHAIAAMYEHDLRDWADAMNAYLSN